MNGDHFLQFYPFLVLHVQYKLTGQVIREIYQKEIRKLTVENKEDNLEQLKRKLLLLKDEETNLGRLLITGKISEAAYDKLRAE